MGLGADCWGLAAVHLQLNRTLVIFTCAARQLSATGSARLHRALPHKRLLHCSACASAAQPGRVPVAGCVGLAAVCTPRRQRTCSPRGAARMRVLLDGGAAGNSRPAVRRVLSCMTVCRSGTPLKWYAPQCTMLTCARHGAHSLGGVMAKPWVLVGPRQQVPVLLHLHAAAGGPALQVARQGEAPGSILPARPAPEPGRPKVCPGPPKPRDPAPPQVQGQSCARAPRTGWPGCRPCPACWPWGPPQAAAPRTSGAWPGLLARRACHRPRRRRVWRLAPPAGPGAP